MATAPSAVVLLSGGLDSSTVAAIAKSQGFAVYALSFDYGQRHRAELDAARRMATRLGAIRHVVTRIDLRMFGGSALTDEIAVPKRRTLSQMGEGIPVTYVPARNTIFLSFATAFAESIGAMNIFIGVNALDYSGYPDCRPEFIHAFEQVANLGTKQGLDGARMTIHAPLIRMTKREIVESGLRLGVDYSQTVSCYDPDSLGRGCGQCDSCQLRLKGFAEAGATDPAPYQGLLEVAG